MLPRIDGAVPLPHTMQLSITLVEMISYSSTNTLLGGVEMKVYLLFIVIPTGIDVLTERNGYQYVVNA